MIHYHQTILIPQWTWSTKYNWIMIRDSLIWKYFLFYCRFSRWSANLMMASVHIGPQLNVLFTNFTCRIFGFDFKRRWKNWNQNQKISFVNASWMLNQTEFWRLFNGLLLTMNPVRQLLCWIVQFQNWSTHKHGTSGKMIYFITTHQEHSTMPLFIFVVQQETFEILILIVEELFFPMIQMTRSPIKKSNWNSFLNENEY